MNLIESIIAVWEKTNLCNDVEKIDYTLIYSEDVSKYLRVVERILLMWDLGNGKNAMRTS